MKPSLETADRSQFQGHEIKEQRAIGFSRQADQFPFRLRGRRIVDVLQVRGLSTQSGAVVNDLAINLSGCVVDKSHRTEKLRAGLCVREETVNLFISNSGKMRRDISSGG